MGEINSYNILTKLLKGKNSFGILGVCGRMILKWILNRKQCKWDISSTEYGQMAGSCE